MLYTKIVAGYIAGKENTLEKNLNEAIKEIKRYNEYLIKKISLQTFPNNNGCISGTALIVYEDYDPTDYI